MDASPPRPALEEYERFAKDLTDACASGDPAALQRIRDETGRPFTLDELREVVQRQLGGQPGAGNRDATVSLADAQRLVAGLNGFDSWPALADHIEAIATRYGVSGSDLRASGSQPGRPPTPGANTLSSDTPIGENRDSNRDIFDELGVAAYINANDWFTSMGGSMLAAPVVRAMAQASGRAVRLAELQNAVDAAIARLTANEAACVTSSATSAIVLAVTAFMSDLLPARSERLPDTRGMKAEVIIHRCDHFGEEAAIRIPGARMIDIGDRTGATERMLEEAITPRTAAVFTTPPRQGMVPLESIVRIAHGRGVGVIVDISWSLPPKDHLWKFTRDAGADVAIVSGGKGLRGPQASGLVLGRKDVADACRQLVPPHCRIGRPMKVGREAMVGIYAAVKHFVNGGAEATQLMADYIAGELAGLPEVAVRVDRPASHVYVLMSPARFRLNRNEIVRRLAVDEPRIMVRPIDDPNGFRVSAGTLSEGHERIVARKLREVLTNALQ